jgi:hypothetical protein
VSLRIVLSASPADARASTNPASTSVSKASISSALDGSRISRMSPTSASANPAPPVFTLGRKLSLEATGFHGE